MRHRAERTYKPRSLRVGNLVHNHCPDRSGTTAKNLRRRCANFEAFATFTAFAAGFAGFGTRRGVVFRVLRFEGASSGVLHVETNVWLLIAALNSPPRRVRTLLLLLPNSLYCILLSTNLRLAPFDDHAVALTLLPRLGAQRRKSPRSLRMISLHAAFTTAVRMVNRVHGHATNRGPLAVPARAASLAVGHILVIEIAQLADR